MKTLSLVRACTLFRSKIKYADILDNMNLTRIASLTERDLKRVEKYHRALATLKELQAIREKPVQVDFFQARGKHPRGKGGAGSTGAPLSAHSEYIRGCRDHHHRL